MKVSVICHDWNRFLFTDRSPSSGIFRRAAEVTFEELRTNRDSLTSVLEAFIHDPLTEWQAAKVRAVVVAVPDCSPGLPTE